MAPEIKAKLRSSYDTDYQLWLDKTVNQLRLRDFSQIDLENLIEEIESLGKSDKRSISSYLMRLCEHLLKIAYWEVERKTCFRDWKLEVVNFRLQIQAILQDSPSLKNYLNDTFAIAYQNGRKLFLTASELNAKLIPEAPEFTLEQALDKEWFPWHPQ